MNRTIMLAVFAAMLALPQASAATEGESPDRDPRNWPTMSRLVADRYEVAGRLYTLRVHAKKTDYFNCAYRSDRGRYKAFTLAGGPLESLTGYMPRELGTVLERQLEADPWAQVTVQVRFNPDKLSELCPRQVDILKWSRGWQYPPDSLAPTRPNISLHPTAEDLRVAGQRTVWKELRKLDSEHIGQTMQLSVGARVSTAYHCAYRGATRSHFALRLHDARGRFIHAYIERNERSRKLVDYIALHRDVSLTVVGKVVKLALSNYCKPQLEITSWTLSD